MWCFQKSFKTNLSCKTNIHKEKKREGEANISIFLGSRSDNKLQSALLELTFPMLLWTLIAGLISELWTLQLLRSSEYQVHCKLFISFLIRTLPLTAPLPLSSLKSSVSECFSVKSYSFFFPEIALTGCPSFVCLLSVLDRTNTFTGKDVFSNNEHEMNIASNCSSNHQHFQWKLQPSTHSVSGQE